MKIPYIDFYFYFLHVKRPYTEAGRRRVCF